MSERDQTINKIRLELGKEKPSKKQILSLLLDQLDLAPTTVFYNLLGKLFQIICEKELSLKILFEPIYKTLQKRISSRFGVEKTKEMDQYLFENFGVYGREHAITKIKQEWKKVDPGNNINWRLTLNARLLVYLKNLRKKHQYRYLSIDEFYIIISDICKINTSFFYDLLYDNLIRDIPVLDPLEMEQYLQKNLNFNPKFNYTTKNTQLMLKAKGGLEGVKFCFILVFIILIIILFIVLLPVLPYILHAIIHG